MSDPSLPPEVADYIIDLLHDEPDVLKQCCLVSKSWVSRSRKHRFHRVRFTTDADLKNWKGMFPDPVGSPGNLTHSLWVICPTAFTAEVKGSGWIGATFLNVVRLDLNTAYWSFSSSELPIIICSLPLLQDLEIICLEVFIRDDRSTVFRPSTSPPLTGSFTISIYQGMEHVAFRLLDLPNDVHFQMFECQLYFADDIRWMVALVEACSDTLEYIRIRRDIALSPADPINLSKAIKLKQLEFTPISDYDISVTWITTTLGTITSKHRDFHEVLIHTQSHFIGIDNPVSAKQAFEEGVYEQWMDLDRVVVQLWELYGVRTKLLCSSPHARGVGILFPEATKSGALVPEQADHTN